MKKYKQVDKRASGILLHITSLPSEYGIGDLGPQAYRFADFLAQAGQSYWQVLPLNPPSQAGNSYSPYKPSSAFAGNTMLISSQMLYRQGLLAKKDIRNIPAFPQNCIDYRLVNNYKAGLLAIAYENFKRPRKASDFERFCLKNKGWLEDYAAFVVLSRHFHHHKWCSWPREFRDRHRQGTESIKNRFGDAISREKFCQYIFFRQWASLKKYCSKRGIKIIGDVSMYVAYDSADAWSNPDIFKLTKEKKPRFIAGVPPDLFSRTGQLWGSPVYDWKSLKDADYQWWFQRIKHNLVLFDIVRLDHFRGFCAYWQVPAGRKNAAKGNWEAGPKEDFLGRLFKKFPSSSFIAEDLGFITADVRGLVEKFALAGTKVLLFAFDSDSPANPHRPDNYVKNSVLYTSTHDSNTIKGWFENEAGPRQKKRLFDYLRNKIPSSRIHLELIRLALASVCDTVIIPVQDVLGLGRLARMNRPAAVRGNWRWRLNRRQLSAAIAENLARLTGAFGRNL